MRRRCSNPNHKSYEGYGSRGITVCEEWFIWDNFYCWAHNNGYQENLTIERINNDGNYQPLNCKWATITEQNDNMRKTHRFTIFNETKTLSQWSRDYRCKVSYDTLYDRIICRKWDLEKAISQPARFKSTN